MSLHSINIPEETLYASVQQLTGVSELRLGEWSCKPLGWKASNEVTGGLYRVSGSAWCKHELLEWSLIVKIVVPARNFDDPGHYNYWKREVLAYQSGLLQRLPGMIKAPRCFAVEEKEDESIRLWLEEAPGPFGTAWKFDDYTAAARILGTFNGAYLTGEPLPDEPWLCRSWLSSWVRECDKYDDRSALHIDTWKNTVPEHEHLFPDDMYARYQAFYRRRQSLLDGLMELPRVLTHNDAWPPNLLLQENSTLLAIDWAFAGIAGIGEELGRFYGLMLHSDSGSVIDTEALFQHYMAGIRDAGWKGETAIVRFGFTASAGIRCGMLVPTIMEQIRCGEPITEEIQARSRVAVQLLELAEEAWALLPQIR